MGQLSAHRPSWRRAAGPWPRSIRRPWVRSNDLPGMSQLLAAIPSLPRAELSRLTTRMIDRLDELDGDPDAEDDDRSAILMVAPGVDYDPAEDRPCIPDGLPGDPDDAEDGHDAEEHADDDFGPDDQGEAGSWPEGDGGGALIPYGDDDHEEDRDAALERRRDALRRPRRDKENRYA